MTMVFTQSMTSVTKVTEWWNQHPRWDQHRVESFHTPSLSIGLNHDQIPGIALMLFLLCNDSSFQNVIFMAVTNRSNRPYLTYSKKKTTSNTSQPAFERNHLGAKGKISASQELRWWGWTRLCWPHAAASCVEATSRLKWMKFTGFLVLRVGGYGWLSHLPRDWNPFSLGFPEDWLWTTNLNHQKTAARKASNIPKKTDPTFPIFPCSCLPPSPAKLGLVRSTPVSACSCSKAGGKSGDWKAYMNWWWSANCGVRTCEDDIEPWNPSNLWHAQCEPTILFWRMASEQPKKVWVMCIPLHGMRFLNLLPQSQPSKHPG